MQRCRTSLAFRGGCGATPWSREFAAWLRQHNASCLERERAGFYGLDLYSLHASMAAVLEYLDTIDPTGAARARYRYSCFEDYGEERQAYGYAAAFNLSRSCEDQVVAQLVDLQRRATEYGQRDGHVAADDYFFAEQNARLLLHAEQYYRSMFVGRPDSWNLRDTHLAETLDALMQHVTRRREPADQAQEPSPKSLPYAVA